MLKKTDFIKRYLDFNDVSDNLVITSEYAQAKAPPVCAKEVRTTLRARVEEVLVYLLPKGRFYEQHFEVGNIDGQSGNSLRVTLRRDKRGLWHDFATGEGGDMLDLWAACHHFDIKTQFVQVLQSASSWLGLASTEPANTNLPSYHYDTLGASTAKWDYHDAKGQLIACVYRYDAPEGKQYRPWDVVNRKHCAPNPRPLYNQPEIKDATQVVLVEGEKAADALINCGIAATTAMFGAKAPVAKTDWSPLTGKRVIIWPDNDEAGKRYAQAVAAHLAKMKLLSSLSVLTIPEDKPNKWDAVDAVTEGIDAAKWLQAAPRQTYATQSVMPAYTAGELLDDTSPMPTDLIAPRVLTPGGLMVLGGAPKVGKSHVLLSWLLHMAGGIPFLGLTPPRPLRVFYLQTEVRYHYLRERLSQMGIDNKIMPLIRKNLVMTPQSNRLLDEDGVAEVQQTIQQHFSREPVDIIAVDPLRNVFDGGEDDLGENNNSSMLFFLQQRLDVLRDAVNPEAGLILAHHTRKMRKQELLADPFQALSGASSLRSYYTTGVMLFKEDEQLSPRKLVFELRNGDAVLPKCIDQLDGYWCEVDVSHKQPRKNKWAAKLAAERKRKQDIILNIIRDEARAGRMYTMNQFCQAFESQSGLGSMHAIRKQLDVLTTKGQVKFFKDATGYGLPNPLRTKFGFLCVESMQIPERKPQGNSATSENKLTFKTVYPTHYKSKQTSEVLPIKRKPNQDYNVDEGAA